MPQTTRRAQRTNRWGALRPSADSCMFRADRERFQAALEGGRTGGGTRNSLRTGGREAIVVQRAVPRVRGQSQAGAEVGATVPGRRPSNEPRRLMRGNLVGRSNASATAVHGQNHLHGRWPAATLREAERSPRNPRSRSPIANPAPRPPIDVRSSGLLSRSGNLRAGCFRGWLPITPRISS